jgi:hypothetical protein
VLFSDRHRWVKFGTAIAVIAALAGVNELVRPYFWPDIREYKTRGAEFDGRQFVIDHERVGTAFDRSFTLADPDYDGLTLTAAPEISGEPPTTHHPTPNTFEVGGVTVKPGDEVGVVGTFRQPDRLVVTSIRRYPLRPWKFAAAVPAGLFVAFLAWRRLRLLRRVGLALAREGDNRHA